MTNLIGPFWSKKHEDQLDALGDKLAEVMQRSDLDALRQAHVIRNQMTMILCGEDIPMEVKSPGIVQKTNEGTAEQRKNECALYLGKKLYSDTWRKEGLKPGTLVEVNGSSAVVDHEHDFLGSRIGWIDAAISRFSHAAFLKRIANGTLRVIDAQEVEDILRQQKSEIQRVLQD